MGMAGPAQPERKARAVQALVVGADVRGQVGEGTDPGQDALGVVGVQPDRLGERGSSSPAGWTCAVACLLEQAGRHGDLAEVVDQPGPAQALLLGCREPEAAGGPGGQAGDPVRVGTAPRGLQVGEVGQRLAHGQAPVTGQLIDRGPRRTRQHVGERDRLIAVRPQAAGQVEVGPRHLRIEIGPGPAADHGRRRPGTAQSAHQVSGQRQVQDLGRARNRLRGPAKSRAAPVMPLILVVDRVLHMMAEPQAGSEVGGDLTVHRHRLVHHRAAPRGEGGQPGQPGRQARVQPQPAHRPGPHAAGTMQVDQVQVKPGNHLIIGEEPGQHRAAGTAPRILDQRPVKDGLQVPGPRPQRAPELDPHKGRVGPVLHLLGRSQARTVGQRAQQLSTAGRLRSRARPICSHSAAHPGKPSPRRSRPQARTALGSCQGVTNITAAGKWGNSPMRATRAAMHPLMHQPNA